MKNVLFRITMVVSSLSMIGLGYSMIAYLDAHWARHAGRLRARGTTPRRTANWENRKFWQGIALLIGGFACMALWFG